MREVIVYLIMLISILAGLYVGGWLMFIKPIKKVSKVIEDGTVTRFMVVITVLKSFLSVSVGCTTYYICLWIGSLFLRLI